MIESARVGGRRRPVWLACAVALTLVVASTLGGCALGGASSTASDSATGLSRLSWCDRPFLNFFDGSSSATSATPITDWNQVRGQLGFTLYLPPSLPSGSCLVLAGGTIHDAIYGSHVSITWDLPTGEPLSISEAPNRVGMASKLQCAASTQDTKTTVCLGAVSGTSITVASRQSARDLESLFNSLRPNVDWVPFGTAQLLETPTATP